MQKIIILKVGGSTLSKSSDNIFDFSFLHKLKEVIEPHYKSGIKFFLELGGGYTSRRYRDLAIEQGISTLEQHWIGTTVNVLHARLVKAFFEDIADEEIIKFEDYYDDSPMNISKNILVGGGGRPGHSSDVDAILAAEKLGANEVFSLKNVDAVYDKDPSKHNDAQALGKLSWDEYLGIIGHKTKHEPGGNYPIDPIASKMAKEQGITFYILGSDDIENIKKALAGEKFKGTIVTD